ncbi:MAG: exodeoxyribonuclease V subunit beta [bacterium]|nr:exodeoxyribonuclease V subunit beta [bacterium]
MKPSIPFNAAEIALRGVHLVEASAGTGKTYAITGLVLRLLLEGESPLRLEQILVVSFTDASTKELVGRVSTRLREALAAFESNQAPPQDVLITELLERFADQRELARKRLALALRSMDDARIFTIHGFCRRQLSDFSFQSGQAFDAELLPDVNPVLLQVCYDFWAKASVELPRSSFDYLQFCKYSAEALLVYLRKIRSHAQLEIPNLKEPTLPSLERLGRLFTQLSAQFNPDQLGKILTHSSLNGNVYRKATVAGLLEELPQWVQGQGAKWPVRSIRLDLCGATKLQAAVKKDKVLPDLPAFCETADAYLAEEETLNQQFGQWERWFRQQFILEAQKAVEVYMDRAALLCFDDLLIRLDRALAGASGEALAQRSGYQAALIDEFQDTDPLQYRIFTRLFEREGRGLFLIGDPKQAIYAFRGADVFAYHQATASAQRYHMDVNWRSDPGVITALNGLYNWSKKPLEPTERARQIQGPFHFGFINYPVVRAQAEKNRLISHRPDYKPVTLHFQTKTDQPDHGKNKSSIQKDWARREFPSRVATQVLELLQSDSQLVLAGQPPRRLMPKDIALLVRENKQGQDLQEALAQCGIPTVFLGNQGLYQTDEARDFQRLLVALIEPRRIDKLMAALAGYFFGLNNQQLAAIRQDDAQLLQWQSRQFRWAQLWREEGFAAMAGALLEEAEIGPRLMAFSDGRRRWSNLLQLIQRLQSETSRGHQGPLELLRLLERCISGEESKKEEVLADTDSQAVTILTIHKSKGLEYPVVFLPYLWNGLDNSKRGDLPVTTYHHPEDDRLCLSLGDAPEPQNWAFEEEFAESLRLLYVALTRAQYQVHLYFGPIGNWWASPLGYLILRPQFDDGATDLAKLLKEYALEMDGESLWSLLEERAAGIEDSLGLVPLVPGPKGRYLPPKTGPQKLAHWPFERHPDPFYRIGSYSSLIKKAAPAYAQETGVDRDGEVLETSPATGAIPLARFPKGAKAGDFFHHFFENLDFAAADKEAIQVQMKRSLKLHHFEVEAWLEPLSDWAETALKTPLSGELGSLGQIAANDRLAEMEFTLPLQRSVLKAQGLAQVFKEHLSEPYGELIAQLGFVPIRGYLKGFVDLFFRQKDRYYLLDYKSNHLGGDFADYTGVSLEEQMCSHHYHLQAWLYCLAAHRHLKARLPGYHYDQHFGGAYYLFLRGLGGGSGSGIHFQRPSLAALTALETLLCGAEG